MGQISFMHSWEGDDWWSIYMENQQEYNQYILLLSNLLQFINKIQIMNGNQTTAMYVWLLYTLHPVLSVHLFSLISCINF